MLSLATCSATARAWCAAWRAPRPSTSSTSCSANSSSCTRPVRSTAASRQCLSIATIDKCCPPKPSHPVRAEAADNDHFNINKSYLQEQRTQGYEQKEQEGEEEERGRLFARQRRLVVGHDDQDQEDSARSDSNSDGSSSNSSSSALALTSGDSSSSNSSSRSSLSVVDVEAKLGRLERKANKDDNKNDEKGDDDHEDEDEDELFGSRGSANRQPSHGAS